MARRGKRVPRAARDLIPMMLCAAATLERRPAQHPFLLGLATTSLLQTHEALLLGVDYRDDPDSFQERLEEAREANPFRLLHLF